MSELRIRKDDLATTEAADPARQPLAPGAVRLKIAAFALTANNVTYAAFGSGPLGYWDFFPAPEGWGRVPVWGFATVEASNADGVAPGSRVYGYLPIAEYLDVVPEKVSTSGFVDASPHRQGKAPIYNQYSFTEADPAYDPAHEPAQMLFRPLYATGWWAADYLMETEAPPLSVVVSSASSKTALAMAHCLKRRGGTSVIGLTSPGNLDYVRSLDLYDGILAYDEVDTLSLAAPAAYVDYRGRPDFTAAVHRALGDALIRSVIIGATEWEADRTPVDMPGPEPEFFFVPDHIGRRVREAGPTLLDAMNADLRGFYAESTAFVEPVEVQGMAAVQSAWADLVAGRTPPRSGLICSL